MEARRYNKSYPGELVHFDTKRLPLRGCKKICVNGHLAGNYCNYGGEEMTAARNYWIACWLTIGNLRT